MQRVQSPLGRPQVPGALLQAGRNAADEARGGVQAVAASWRILLQTTVAACLAYGIGLAIGHQDPFFAPIAAISTVAISMAQRLRRTTELLIGNAIGILFADVLIARIGTGIWQLGLVVLIALVLALFLGGGPILIMQASSSAILISTLSPPTAAQPWNTGRFTDAIVGGAVGLLIATVLLPVHPARIARRATDPLVATLADGCRELAAALRTEGEGVAASTLTSLRASAPVLAEFGTGMSAARDALRLTPWHWGNRTIVEPYLWAGPHLDNALRNLRVAARQASAALHRREPIPVELPALLDDLAAATERLGEVLAENAPADELRRRLLDVSTRAARVGVDVGTSLTTPGLFVTPMLTQIRFYASDLLQASGLTDAEATGLLREADRNWSGA